MKRKKIKNSAVINKKFLKRKYNKFVYFHNYLLLLFELTVPKLIYLDSITEKKATKCSI